MSINPAQMIHRNVMVDVLTKKLRLSDRAALARVCKLWNSMIQPILDKEWLRVLESITFGRDYWLKIPGVVSVSEHPPLTAAQVKAIKAKIAGECVLFNEEDKIEPHRFQDNDDIIKMGWQTKKVILFPEKVNDDPRTVINMGKLFRFEREGDEETVFNNLTGEEEGEDYLTQAAPGSYYAIVTLDVVPGTRNTTQIFKETLLATKGYRIPTTPNEATTAQLLMNIGPSKEKEGYFFPTKGEKYWTYTITSMQNKDGKWLGAGATMDHTGPEVDIYFCGDEHVGAAAVWEVPNI